MLRILPPANDPILPQAELEVYFFNRIGRFLTVTIGWDRPSQMQ